MKQILQQCACLLAGVWTATAVAQSRLCDSLPHEEQMYARASGACRDAAPNVDGSKRAPASAFAVANVVGLSWDEARAQLGRFTVQRSYRASAEPGGTVLSQQPTPPARLAARAVVRLVLSDGTLRPPPNVPASQVDGIRPPAVSEPVSVPPPSAAVDSAPTVAPAGQSAPTASAGGQPQPDATRLKAPASRRAPARVEQLKVPNVIGLSIKNAQTRLARFQIERTDRYSPAPAGRVIAQTPRASARLAAGQPVELIVSRGPEPAVTETFELPNVVDRTYADASGALAEFKINRADVPNAAPAGTVLAQDPAPGTHVAAGSAVALQVSDGSLAAPFTAPAVPAPQSAADATAAQAVPPVPGSSDPNRVRLSNTELTIGAAIFLALVIVTLLVRQWLGRRRHAPTIEVPAHAEPAPAAAPSIVTPAPEIRFSARFDPGEVTIEFSGSSDPEETTPEYSSAHHE